ncbi:MAG: hypothetical protein NZM12_01475 [Steroidobacteraceae bacterium]|nr:hypothetical protein [Steroidobacteraceae bacterium]MDW8260843.1 hypothetical protein [Gammaproteobacteria bacterium]
MKNHYKKISFDEAREIRARRAGHIVPRMADSARDALVSALDTLYGRGAYHLAPCVDGAETAALDLLDGCDAVVEFRSLKDNKIARMEFICDASYFDWYVVDNANR